MKQCISSFLLTSLMACVTVLCHYNSNAQTVTKLDAKAIKDSIIVLDNENLATNNITVTNNGHKAQRIAIRTQIPKGWRNLNDSKYLEGDVVYYNLYPQQNIKIPIVLLKMPDASPHWSQVNLQIWNREVVSDTQFYSFSLRTVERKSYRSAPRNINIDVDKENSVVPVKLYIKNTGNVEDVYTITYYNYKLQINDSIRISLPVDADTVLVNEIDFNNYQINNFSSANLSVSIKNTSGISYSYAYSLFHHINKNKGNHSAYYEIPLRLEGGYLMNGQKHTYYGAASGNIKFDKYRSFNFKYRSKRFSNVPTGIQRNVFRAQYTDKHWSATVGQVSMPLYFLNNPYRGISLSYFKDDLDITVSGSVYDTFSFAKNNNVSVEVRHKVGKVKFKNTVFYNSGKGFDGKDSVNGVILATDAELISKRNLTLGLEAGVGISKYIDNKYAPEPTPGFLMGYRFGYTLKKLSFTSRFRLHDENFPGIRSGSSNTQQELNWQYKNGNIGLFYSYNYMTVNPFRDSLFNSDKLNFNTSRYGVMFNNSFGNFNSSVSTGILNQKGDQIASGLGKSYFLDLNAGYTKNSLIANLVTQTAMTKIANGTTALTLTSALNVNSRHFGFNAIYTRMPRYNYESNGEEYINGNIETVNGGPNVNFYLFRNRLIGSVRYNVSKTLKDDRLTQGVGGSLMYSSPKNGLSVDFNCFVPFSMQTNDPGLPIANRQFAQLSVIKDLNIPIIFNRKYFDLRLTLYEDANNNQILDDNEELLRNVKLLIDGEPFISNRKGTVLYKNISKGEYDIQIQNKDSDIIPLNGFIQMVTVNDNTHLAIPFKRAKILTGKINIIYDSLSNNKNLSQIVKITATDAGGNQFVTVAGENGNFRLSLNAGTYTVSISQSFLSGEFIADKISEKIDLTQANEENVTFTLRQKTRKIRFLKQ